jgi:hypothetical protein
MKLPTNYLSTSEDDILVSVIIVVRLLSLTCYILVVG